MDNLIETEAQAEARVRATKTRRALLMAPELAFELAQQILPEGGRTEPGEHVPVERIPFRGRVLDDLNLLYGGLAESVLDFAHDLGVEPPESAWTARWQHRTVTDPETREVYSESNVWGLPHLFTAGQAQQLTRGLSVWLISNLDSILDLPVGVTFADETARVIWRFRFRYGLVLPSARAVSPRSCPNPECEGGHVQVEFFGEPFAAAEQRREFELHDAGFDPTRAVPDERRDPRAPAGAAVLQAIAGIGVRCPDCGWTVEPRATEIVRWLG